MNTNLLNIVKQIIAERGDSILDDPQRLKAFFADYAKDEPKQERIAFGRCVEMGCYAELKSCGSVEERQYKKSKLADTLHRNTGIDRPYCADALDLLEVVIFGEQKKNLCKNCGKEMQAGWKSCPFCEDATANNTARNQGKDKTRYYLSYNYKETGPYDRAAIKVMVANRQIAADYFVRAEDSTKWEPITTLCKFPKTPKAVHSPEYQSSNRAKSQHDSTQKNFKASSDEKEKYDKKKQKALWLCTYLGFLGIHRFYLGRIFTGFSLLVCFLMFLLGVPLLFSGTRWFLFIGLEILIIFIIGALWFFAWRSDIKAIKNNRLTSKVNLDEQGKEWHEY